MTVAAAVFFRLCCVLPRLKAVAYPDGGSCCSACPRTRYYAASWHRPGRSCRHWEEKIQKELVHQIRLPSGAYGPAVFLRLIPFVLSSVTCAQNDFSAVTQNKRTATTRTTYSRYRSGLFCQKGTTDRDWRSKKTKGRRSDHSVALSLGPNGIRAVTVPHSNRPLPMFLSPPNSPFDGETLHS